MPRKEKPIPADLTAMTPDELIRFYRMAELLNAVGEVLQAFEDGYFVRTTKLDHQSDWAVKLLGPLRSLSKLKEIYDAERPASCTFCGRCNAESSCPHCGKPICGDVLSGTLLPSTCQRDHRESFCTGKGELKDGI